METLLILVTICMAGMAVYLAIDIHQEFVWIREHPWHAAREDLE